MNIRSVIKFIESKAKSNSSFFNFSFYSFYKTKFTFLI